MSIIKEQLPFKVNKWKNLFIFKHKAMLGETIFPTEQKANIFAERWKHSCEGKSSDKLHIQQFGEKIHTGKLLAIFQVPWLDETATLDP